MKEANILDFWGIDPEQIKKTIEDSLKLEDDEAFFTQLTEVVALKKAIKDTLEMVDAHEAEVKGLINAKAKKLYGNDWQTIKGAKFKITRSKTGDMYLVNGKPNPKFIKIKKTVDSKAVEEFLTTNDKLPAGIEINDKRGESLRINVQ